MFNLRFPDFHGPSTHNDYIGTPDGYVADELITHMKQTFHDRFMSAREHVVAAYRNVVRRHGSNKAVILPTHKDYPANYDCREVEKLGTDIKSVNIDQTFWETLYPHGIDPKSQNDYWEDTAQELIPYRLEPPERSDATAGWMFPAHVGRCKHCDPKSLQWRMIIKSHKYERDSLTGSNPRYASLLSPIQFS